MRAILRSPKSMVRGVRNAFFVRGTARTRLVVVVLFLLGLAMGVVDSPAYWNRFTDRVSQQIRAQEKIEKIPVPYVYRFGIGIFYAHTNNTQIPHLTFPFQLGLDLQGGAHLVYEADVSKIGVEDRTQALEGIRDVIERRVNFYGVTEPVVQVVTSAGGAPRLIVELPGKNAEDAIRFVGDAPFLEFREETGEGETLDFIPTGLTGEYLKRADLAFDQTTRQPLVAIEFNEEGAKKFEEITSRNVNKRLAIFIDEIPISAPRVQEAISGGKAQISGDFTIDTAKTLARNLTAGALPVPIKLILQQSIGPSLGKASLNASVRAGAIGIFFVALFMVLYYRLAGVIAILALGFYAASVLFLLKVLSVTLTLPGIAGFILSIGMAVDANVLTFERMKEERRAGKSFAFGLDESFRRSWPPIRDAHISTLLTAAILFWIGTGFIKGFALTLGLGLIMNLFSALVVTRSLLKLFVGSRIEAIDFLWNAGFMYKKT